MRPTERESGAVWRLLSAWAAKEQEQDRFHRKVTQGDMARMFGVSSQTVSTWKRCQARMPMASQLRVIKATDISLDELTAALAEDEPRIAEWVASRREEEGGGERGDRSAPTSGPPDAGGTDVRLGDSDSSPDPALIVKRYLRQANGDVATAASLLAHDGAKGANTDEDTWFAALEQLHDQAPAGVVVELPKGAAARRSKKRPPKGPGEQGAD